VSEKRGRLRTRATLYFLLTALPAAMVSAGAVIVLDRLIAQEIGARTREIVRLTEQVMTDETKRVKRSVERLAQLEEIRQLAAAVDDASAIEAAESLASARAGAADLDLFAIVAASGPYEGDIASSAHLPDSAGDPAPRFLQGLETPAVGVAHELVEGNPPQTVPALVAVVSVDRSDGRPALRLYGGSRLDGHQLSGLARMAGATLVLTSPPLPPKRFAVKDQAPARPSTTIELAELPGAARGATQIEVAVHTPRLEAARTTFFTLSVVLVAASLFVALISGGLLSNRITRPILELSEAAREVGRGNLDVRIAPRSNDEVGALVEVFNDMTRELRDSRERLQRAERIAAWREIARRVAHEIKNPLFPIQMSMETLKKSWDKKHPKLDEIVAESTKTVLEEVRALNRIVTEFSEFARLPAPERELSSVADLLSHVAGLYKDAPNASRVVFDRQAADALPPIAIDKEQLGRALINLVKNALEALEPSGGTVHLDARAARGGIEIRVSDDGPGIPPEIRDKLFTPYVTTKASGTGLGLAIVDRIVSEHEGTVDVTSSSRGTVFTIWLPVSR
jgi:nitrogen fixation/metabolism regulation signal transduction histidine kinase